MSGHSSPSTTSVRRPMTSLRTRRTRRTRKCGGILTVTARLLSAGTGGIIALKSEESRVALPKRARPAAVSCSGRSLFSPRAGPRPPRRRRWSAHLFCRQPLRPKRPFCEYDDRRRVWRRQAARWRLRRDANWRLSTPQRRKLASCPLSAGADWRPVRPTAAQTEAVASKKARFPGRRCVWSDVFWRTWRRLRWRRCVSSGVSPESGRFRRSSGKQYVRNDARRGPPDEDCESVFTTQIHCQLPLVLINTEVKHSVVSWNE